MHVKEKLIEFCCCEISELCFQVCTYAWWKSPKLMKGPSDYNLFAFQLCSFSGLEATWECLISNKSTDTIVHGLSGVLMFFSW